ncbi:MAG: DUF924 family protein [Tissierellia bacterium]|nr:DUF924 family protein [Tissierellia bacterium]
MIKDYKDVLDFWFDPKNIPRQFTEEPEFDELIRSEFLSTWRAASEGLLFHWRETCEGRLAEIIVLDQFSRNLWRNNILTYTQDKMAIALAQELIKLSEYRDLPTDWKKFALLPFMHSESLSLHKWAAKYFDELAKEGDEMTKVFEQMHLDVLKRFGRYPYQNEDLGRESTAEELEFLKSKRGKIYSIED